jgi:hypothetical protein
MELVVSLLIIQALIIIQTVKSQCRRRSYDRGVGVPISSCLESEDRIVDLCYPKCRDGYKAVGVVCWQVCPDGYTDTGAFCTKPARSYGKCCCTEFSKKCCNRCKSGYKDTGCTCFSASVTIVI